MPGCTGERGGCLIRVQGALDLALDDVDEKRAVSRDASPWEGKYYPSLTATPLHKHRGVYRVGKAALPSGFFRWGDMK